MRLMMPSTLLCQLCCVDSLFLRIFSCYFFRFPVLVHNMYTNDIIASDVLSRVLWESTMNRRPSVATWKDDIWANNSSWAVESRQVMQPCETTTRARTWYAALELKSRWLESARVREENSLLSFHPTFISSASSARLYISRARTSQIHSQKR